MYSSMTFNEVELKRVKHLSTTFGIFQQPYTFWKLVLFNYTEG